MIPGLVTLATGKPFTSSAATFLRWERKNSRWIHVSAALFSKNLTAKLSYPANDVSLKDGFAVRSEDVEAATPEQPVNLRVSGSVFAGFRLEGKLSPGCAVKIWSGGAHPTGRGCRGIRRILPGGRGRERLHQGGCGTGPECALRGSGNKGRGRDCREGRGASVREVWGLRPLPESAVSGSSAGRGLR